MLLNWIEQTRKKPKAVRNQYAFVGAFVITSCIALIWVVSLPTQLAEMGEKGGETEKTQENQGSFAKFFSKAKQNFAAALKTQPEEPPLATSTEPVAPVAVPRLESNTIADVQDEYAESLLPQPRTVLIGTTSADLPASTAARQREASPTEHTNATKTAE